MPIGLSHGDPCSRCPESRPGKPVLAATHFGMCSLCWLGASERQRRAARWAHPEGSAPDDNASLHARFDAFYATRSAGADAVVGTPAPRLEALLAIPAVEPTTR